MEKKTKAQVLGVTYKGNESVQYSYFVLIK